MDTKADADSPPSFHVMSYGLGLLTALLLVGGSVWLLRRPDPAPIVLHPPPSPTPMATATATPPPAPLVVFVSGAVIAPGVYRLPPDARVQDALLAAGGLQPGIDPATLNQAERLFDGAQLYVAATAGASPGSVLPPVTTPQPPGLTGSLGSAVRLGEQPRSGLAGTLPTPTTSPGMAAVTGLINVNTASAEELDALPGIGPTRAQEIIANRPYGAIADLDRVPGIGPSMLERLRPLITTGP